MFTLPLLLLVPLGCNKQGKSTSPIDGVVQDVEGEVTDSPDSAEGVADDVTQDAEPVTDTVESVGDDIESAPN